MKPAYDPPTALVVAYADVLGISLFKAAADLVRLYEAGIDVHLFDGDEHG